MSELTICIDKTKHTYSKPWTDEVGGLDGWIMIYERLRKFKVGQFAYRTRELLTMMSGRRRNEFIRQVQRE